MSQDNTNEFQEGIDPTKLSSKFLTGKIKAYTLDKTEEAIQTIDDIPDVLVLHSLTNDLTTKPKEECVNKMDKIIEDTHKRHPDLKIIISLPTPRADDESLNIKAQMLSIMLKEKFNNKDNVTLCDNSNMAYKGTPIQKFLDSKDKYHLSNSGVSMLAANMRDCIDQVLGFHQRSSNYATNERNNRKTQNTQHDKFQGSSYQYDPIYTPNENRQSHNRGRGQWRNYRGHDQQFRGYRGQRPR
ncbi:unnamed protein product [Mytilus coruscus]|uniref:SGNH hydrolase-type esterase domain-containing protein n=1 Tax=Mytilus coruscus TaxID=42192 RepID=A0A6J8CUW7_MYTCO|nr:unnamed protein product [Mytilus coruscus]